MADVIRIFQFTLNTYGKEIEPGLPSLERWIESFRCLSEVAGPKRVIWRYDPVLLSDRYTVAWQTEQFGKAAEALQGSVERCVISFADLYEKVKRT